MHFKNQLTKTPYLVLFIFLGAISIGTASALITITLDGNVIVTGDIEVEGSITGVETLEGLNCTPEQIARFDGNNWICGKFTAKNNPITTVDNTEDTQSTSIAIGADGLPVISYWEDVLDTNLVVVHCGNTLCSSGNTKTVVDNADDVGEHSSIAIGTDGLPVISYYDATLGDLKVAHCGNTLCNSGNTITAVDSTVDDVGGFTSIAIGADDNPVISYYDYTNGDLKIAHCGNILCSSDNDAKKIAGGVIDTGKYTSIAIGTDNNPVISFYDDNSDELKFGRCDNITCDFLNTNTTVDTAASTVGQYTSIAIGTDGLPVISYYDNTNGDLKVAHCGNMSCNGGNELTTVDGDTSDVGKYTSIAIGADGNPVISYYDDSANDLKVVHCDDLMCHNSWTIITLDRENNVGQDTSIAIGADDNPVISYRADNNLGVAVDGIVLIFE